jgi:hypothetical protein
MAMLAETLFGLSPKMQMIVGGIAVVGILLMSSSGARSGVGGFISMILENFTKKSYPDAFPTPTDSASKMSSLMQVHESVAELLDYFSRTGDEAGVQYTAAVGQHVYKRQVELASKPKTIPENQTLPSF